MFLFLEGLRGFLFLLNLCVSYFVFLLSGVIFSGALALIVIGNSTFIYVRGEYFGEM